MISTFLAVGMLNEVDPELRQATLIAIGEWFEGSTDPQPDYPTLGNIWLGLHGAWLRPRLADLPAGSETVAAFFAVIEQLAEDGDDAVRGFVEYGICEALRADEPLAERAVPLLGPRTLALYASGEPTA